MDRLTTDNPETNLQALLNYAYAKDKAVHLAFGNGEDNIPLDEYIAHEACERGCPKTAKEVMDGGCMECDCPIAILNTVAIQAAELRGRLKMIEDILGDTYDLDHLRELVKAEREGRLIVLPCKPGDTVYEVVPACDGNYDFCTYRGGRGNFRCASNMCGGYVVEVPFDALFRHMIGKTLFLTRTEAEAALAKDTNVPGKKEE